ncbi:MAG: MotA/TolQ/ExbB proton channel family protein [bacterium]
MIELLVDDLRGYIADGGFVMPPLVAATVLLWYGLGYRLFALRRGRRGDVRRLVEAGRMPRGGVLGAAMARVAPALGRALSQDDLDALLTERLAPVRRDLTRFRALVHSLVIIAPLAGLLGTVTGMIETFDGLGQGALFAASGGVAGGISQALLTTQMGLVVAVPGVIAGRLLDRRQRGLEDDLDVLREVLVAREAR